MAGSIHPAPLIEANIDCSTQYQKAGIATLTLCTSQLLWATVIASKALACIDELTCVCDSKVLLNAAFCYQSLVDVVCGPFDQRSRNTLAQMTSARDGSASAAQCALTIQGSASFGCSHKRMVAAEASRALYGLASYTLHSSSSGTHSCSSELHFCIVL